MLIAENSDYQLLCKAEEEQPLDLCYEKWEELIRENGKVSGKSEYASYFANLKSYSKLIEELNVVQATIFISYFEIDDFWIAFLNKKGYKINTTATVNRTQEYEISLDKAYARSNNLKTKLEMKYKQILKASEGSKGSNKSMGFEELMAHLNVSLGFTVEDTLTLARYNEYNKIIKKKNERVQKK